MLEANYKNLIIFSDGGARGNPGPAGIGAVFYNEEGNVVFEISEYIGKTTNNQAEYRAILSGILKAKELGTENLICHLDSELVVKQLNREYKVKNKDLFPLFVKVYNLAQTFKSIKFIHVSEKKILRLIDWPIWQWMRIPYKMR